MSTTCVPWFLPHGKNMATPHFCLLNKNLACVRTKRGGLAQGLGGQGGGGVLPDVCDGGGALPPGNLQHSPLETHGAYGSQKTTLPTSDLVRRPWHRRAADPLGIWFTLQSQKC